MSANDQRRFARFNPAQPGAQGMKVVATGLLVAMAGVFFAARAFQPHFPAGLRESVRRSGDGRRACRLVRGHRSVPPPARPADPHTAIIPRNKDRIGEALANFLKENFLIPSVVARRMRISTSPARPAASSRPRRAKESESAPAPRA